MSDQDELNGAALPLPKPFGRLPETSRRAYLEAMGISLWRWSPRGAAESAAEPASAALPEPAVVSASSEAQAMPADPIPARPGSAESPENTTDGEPAVPPPAVAASVVAGPDAAPDWSGLRAAVAACKACSLHESRTQTVFGVGAENAELMIIGEAPGADEDRQGEPFVGAAGRLLNEMLLAIGLQREQVFIANILKCRPPGNRDPKAEEVAACHHFLQRQIAWIQPRLILAVGRISAQQCLASDKPIGQLRGQLHHYGDTGIPLLATYHPAYLLRSPAEKRKVWQDLKRVRQHLRA